LAGASLALSVFSVFESGSAAAMFGAVNAIANAKAAIFDFIMIVVLPIPRSRITRH
jgi:hypothetical protein